MISSVDGLRFGQLVKSIAGRDSGAYYVIVRMMDDHTIEVTDGKKHPIAKPKKKNLKHVKVAMIIATDVEAAVENGQYLSDPQVMTAISRMKNQLEEGDRFHG